MRFVCYKLTKFYFIQERVNKEKNQKSYKKIEKMRFSKNKNIYKLFKKNILKLFLEMKNIYNKLWN